MTIAELESMGIKQWNLISDGYDKPDLLLGNGFSINLSIKFLYSSLFNVFIGKTEEKFKVLFNQFGTKNFEQILNYLTHALKINEILGLPTKIINQAIDALKKGLIEAIEEVHPRVAEIDKNKLEALAGQFREYGNIYTTNYDLFLYRIILISNRMSKTDNSYNKYQDYFRGIDIDQYVQFTSKPVDISTSKNIFYLHGALFIFNKGIEVLKIIRDENQLIEIISGEIREGRFPLFITEGDADDKMNSIKISSYLNFCLESFSKSNNPLLIFGNSLSDFDSHIVKALIDQPRKLVVSIYTSNKTRLLLEKETTDIKVKFQTYAPDNLMFVDSASVFVG